MQRRGHLGIGPTARMVAMVRMVTPGGSRSQTDGPTAPTVPRVLKGAMVSTSNGSMVPKAGKSDTGDTEAKNA